MDRFDKFTDGARKVLTYAQDEAQRFNHNYIGTEHILLGLVREQDGVAARVLESMGIQLPMVRTAVGFIIGRGDRPVVMEVGLTPRAKRVIELAIDEARGLEHDYIGTEHLLLGLVREGEGIAAGVLESLGVNLDRLRHEIVAVLGTTTPVPSRSTPVPPPTMPISVEDAEASLERSRAYWDVQGSGLRRVVGIGHVEQLGPIFLELVALEVRDAGSILYCKARSSGESLHAEPSMSARDDLGNEYVVHAAAWAANPQLAKGEFILTPAPPADAKTFHLTIDGLPRLGGPRRFRRRQEPWQFDIPLA